MSIFANIWTACHKYYFVDDDFAGVEALGLSHNEGYVLLGCIFKNCLTGCHHVIFRRTLIFDHVSSFVGKFIKASEIFLIVSTINFKM